MPSKNVNGKARINPSITLNQEIYEYLELWADEEDRSIGAQIAYIIKRAVKEKYGEIETNTKIVHRRPRTKPTPQNETKPRRRKES